MRADPNPGLSITPLDHGPPERADTPKWARAIAPAALIAPLTPGDGARCYAVIDGTRRKALRGAMDLDLYDETLRAAPLFRTGTPLDEQGPWLLDLGASDRARRDFLSDHFRNFAGHRCGVFLRSPADQPDIARHLRGLLRVARPHEGNPEAQLFLRIWDPMVARHVLTTAQMRPERLARLFFTHAGAPVSWLLEDGPGHHLLIAASGTPKGPRAPLQLDARDDPVLWHLAWAALQDELQGWMATAYPAVAALPEDGQRRLVAHILHIGRQAGFTLKDEFAYLGHMMTLLGGWFMQGGQYPRIEAILRDPAPARHKPLRAALAEAWHAAPATRIAPIRAALIADFAALPQVPFIDEPALRALLARHLRAADHAALRAFLALLDRESGSFLPEQRPANWLLSLLLGYRFHDDPMREWAGRGWEEAATAAFAQLLREIDG